jgi:hypothetical protein
VNPVLRRRSDVIDVSSSSLAPTLDWHSPHKKSPKVIKAAQYATPALPDVNVESC